jgi:prepilin-type N-terminal cleavage/methylation domain-containing protein
MHSLRQVSGFSLIELMIVISIISILAAIAIPTYQNYTKRARFVEVIGAAGIYKTAISLALQQGLALSELANGVHGIPMEPKASKNLASVKVENGVVIAQGGEIVDDATYILTPSADGSRWTVSGSCLQYGLCSA